MRLKTAVGGPELGLKTAVGGTDLNWLFHDYGAGTGLLTRRAYNASAGLSILAQDS